MNRILSAGTAGLLSTLAIAVPASASPVTIRVEGAAAPLVTETAVDPAVVGTLTRDGAACNGTNTAAGALELGTASDWDGTDFGFGVSVDTIRKESYPFSTGKYWGLYVNGAAAQSGACDQPVATGDEVLFAATCANADATACFRDGVLGATVAPTVRPNEPFPVTITQTNTVTSNDPPYDSTTTTSPAGGASVGGATADANGVARVTTTQRGALSLRVTREQQVPDTVATCVTDGADGFCGTRRPDGTTLPPEIGGVPATPAVADKSAPEGTISGIAEGQRFSRSKAPRRLQAAVSDPSGVLQVKLALTRQVGKRCWWFSGSRERFVRSRCGKRPRFKLDGTGDVDYLLPERLGKGRYVFDVLATDKAYNRDELARGRNRVVFTVR